MKFFPLENGLQAQISPILAQTRPPERCESPRHVLNLFGKNTANEISSIAVFHYLNIVTCLRSSKFLPQMRKIQYEMHNYNISGVNPHRIRNL